MTLISLLGIAAAGLTTAAYVPQAYKTIKTRDTSGLSISTFSLLFLGTILWFAYGMFIKDIPLVLANGFVMILSGIIFFIKLQSLRSEKAKLRVKVAL